MVRLPDIAEALLFTSVASSVVGTVILLREQFHRDTPEERIRQAFLNKERKQR